MPEAIDYQTRELIALGAAYAINCIKCMKVHRHEAIKAGLSKEAMNAAFNVAESVLNGARGITQTEVNNLFGHEVSDDGCCPPGSECCEQEV